MMRRSIKRWITIVAVVAGLGAGASSLPAGAATPSSSKTTSSTSAASTSSRSVQPMDWWL